MNTTLTQAIEPSEQIVTTETQQAVVELDVVELAYVGGGCGMVHFH